MNVLVLNVGSSSLKWQLFEDGERIHRDTIEHARDAYAAANQVFDSLNGEIHAIGHRVVHGGEHFAQPVVINDTVRSTIEACEELAPLHNAPSLAAIRAATDRFGGKVPQVGVFDTSFHLEMPEHAYLYAVPYDWYTNLRVRRYGFHGISHRYVTHRYFELTGRPREGSKIISLHLGNGCSVAAVQDGRSIDTSMGMTPLEGLVMGTRCGDLDAGILPYLARKLGLSFDELESKLNRECGLLGLSQQSSDLREIAPDSRALDVFCYRAKKYIGAYMAAMSGADAIIFTGGIGEHSPDIRNQICSGFEWAGLRPDQIHVIPTDEERQIETEVRRLLQSSSPQ